MRKIFFIILLLVTSSVLLSCNGQNKKTAATSGKHSKRVGDDCEKGYCELMYYGIPENIHYIDTSAGWYEKGQKLIVTGTVFQLDGKTPAPGVILYYHHTDNDGYYSPRKDKPENQTRHGHLRGWVKTDANGKYSIYTIRPAPYPNDVLPAHIHIIIKEPDIGNEYWVDDLVFKDDPLLVPYQKKYPEKAPRCGSGLLQVILKDSVQIAAHHFMLGLNIPNYPDKKYQEK